MATDLKNRFLKEISRCLILSDEDKTFWISRAESLHPDLLNSIYLSVKNKNDLVDKYILAAVKDDPKLLSELKSRINKIKTDAIAAEEKALSPDADIDLTEQLKKI